MTEFDPIVYGKKMEWMLSTDFGMMVFIMLFLTWGLVLINLVLGALLMTNKLFGKKGMFSKEKK